MTYQSSNVGGASYLKVYDKAEFKLGTRITFHYGTNNDKFVEAVFVKALATLPRGELCELPLVSGTDAYQVDTEITTTNGATLAAATGDRFAGCIPLVALATGEYGFVAVKGIIPVSLAANCAVGKPLHTTATAGVVDDTVTTHRVTGLFSTVTITTAAIADCIAYQDISVEKIS
jgi:hypothetical protein